MADGWLQHVYMSVFGCLLCKTGSTENAGLEKDGSYSSTEEKLQDRTKSRFFACFCRFFL